MFWNKAIGIVLLINSYQGYLVFFCFYRMTSLSGDFADIHYKGIPSKRSSISPIKKYDNQ